MPMRKISLTREVTFADMGKPTERPLTRAVGAVVIDNPFAGRFIDDLSPFFAQGAEIGTMLMKDLVPLLPNGPVAYGKAAIVGVNGEIEHGAALLHPQLGQPIRAGVGGGQAIICANAKIGAVGSSIDLPLAHKDNIWSFDHLDTFTVSLADAPRPNEIVVFVSISDAGRPHPRVGKGHV